MRWVLDTNIAILLRDNDPAVVARVNALPSAPMLSVLSRVELEGGVYRQPHRATDLRARVDAMLAVMEELSFTSVEAAIYGRILAHCGYSRTRIIDRMIAAQAMAIGATLATRNHADFRDIPDLLLEDWAE